MRPATLQSGSEAVQGTNDDAQISKLSCVQRGYFEDRFVRFFVRRGAIRPPLINRGYFTRHAAIEQLIHAFLGVSDQAQVVSLGAGFDTIWFRLQDQNLAPCHFFEVDFKEVTKRKADIIGAHPELSRLLGPHEHLTVDSSTGRIQSPKYCLLPGDLRDAEGVQQLLQQAGLQPELPTLVLAECVLVYLQPLESASLLRQLGCLLPTAACIVYEQIRPEDAFGQQMLLNLERRGCPLLGLHATPSLAAHKQRFLNSGWMRASATDLDTVYRLHLDPKEKRRIERLEVFDEFEEWHLIQEHYCIAIGINDALGILGSFSLSHHSSCARPVPAAD